MFSVQRLNAIKGGSIRGRAVTFLVAAARGPLAILVPPGAVTPPPNKPMVDLIGMPWDEYAALRRASPDVELTEEPLESLDYFVDDMRCGYVSYDCSEKRQVKHLEPRSGAVALLSEEVYCELAGLGRPLELTMADLDELLR